MYKALNNVVGHSNHRQSLESARKTRIIALYRRSEAGNKPCDPYVLDEPCQDVSGCESKNAGVGVRKGGGYGEDSPSETFSGALYVEREEATYRVPGSAMD